MGTNFYMFTDSKDKKNKWFDESKAELVDDPDLGYRLHVAKTSIGWLPLFELSKTVNCVKDIKEAVNDGVKLVDEYGKFYNWDEFSKRVLDFGKGDKEMKSHIALNDYHRERYSDAYNTYDTDPPIEYRTDGEGYEFTNREFC